MTQSDEFMNVPMSSEDDGGIDFKEIIGIIASWWWLLIICVGIGLGIAFVKNRYAVDEYLVKATVLIESEINTGVMPGGDMFGSSNRRMDNQIGILKSYTMAEQTLRTLDFDINYVLVGNVKDKELYPTRPFFIDFPDGMSSFYNAPITIIPQPNDQFLVKVAGENATYEVESGEAFKLSIGSLIFVSTDITEDYIGKEVVVTARNIENLARDYANRLQIKSTYGSMVELSMSTTVFARDSRYINRLVEVYVQREVNEKNQVAENTINFIDQQLALIGDSLAFVESAMRDFRTKSSFSNLTGETERIFSRIEEKDAQKQVVQRQINYYDYLDNYLTESDNFEAILAPATAGIEDGIMSSLVQEIYELSNRIRNLTTGSNIDNPTLVDLRRRLSDKRSVLQESVRNVKAPLQTRLRELNSEIGIANRELNIIPAQEREYVNIQRKYSLNEGNFNFLMQKKSEAQISKAATIPAHKVIDPSKGFFARIGPKKEATYLMGIGIGLALPLLFILLKEFLDERIKSSRKLQKSTDIPIIGMVGHNDLSYGLVVHKSPKSPVAESFRAIRTNLQFFALEKDKKIFIVTSSVSGEGKSFCSMNMASVLAVGNKKTLLMGLDLRKPRNYTDFGLGKIKGLTEYMVGEATKDEIVHTTSLENLDILPSGPAPPNPAELLMSDKFRTLLEELKEKYHYIVMDTPPVNLVADALELIKHADLTLYVVRQKYTTKPMLDFINGQFEKQLTGPIQIVYNDYVPNRGYGYGYGYGYGEYYEVNEADLAKKRTWLWRRKHA